MKKISSYYIVSFDEIKSKFKDKPNPIEWVKEELTIIPKKIGNDDPFPMITYKIEGDLMYVPYAWGMEYFGNTNNNDLSKGHYIEVNSNIIPRDDQYIFFDDVYDALHDKHRILVDAPPGSGKTVVALKMVEHLKRTTAVIVGKITLIQQWRDAIKKFLHFDDSEIGLIQADSFDYKDKKIVLISTDSFYNREFDNNFLSYFGLVIYDEHHNFNAQKKFSALGRFKAYYQMGLSATHDRIDGRDKVNSLWYGEISVKGNGLKPIPIQVRLVPYEHNDYMSIDYNYFEEHNIDPRWSEISHLSKIKERNNLILRLINYEYKQGNHILAVSDRVEQLQYFYSKLINSGIPKSEIGVVVSSIYTGKFRISINIDVDNTKPFKSRIRELVDNPDISIIVRKDSISAKGFSRRSECYAFFNRVVPIVSDYCTASIKSVEKEKRGLKEEEISAILGDRSRKIILSSYGKFKEGVSVWWINRLIDCTPQSRPEQLLGRIGRKAEDDGGKSSPVAYSIVDRGKIPASIRGIHRSRIRNYGGMDYVNTKWIRV